MRRLRFLVPVMGYLLLLHPVLAATFSGEVVRVKDGDSIIVYRADMQRRSEIRLAGIDAPELAQPWGIQSRSALRRLIDGKVVEVEVTDRDRYGRLVGKVWRGRVYVNAAMTAGGHAWAYRRYLNDPAIRAGQQQARAARRGLWSLPPEQQLPPPDWRATHPYRRN